MATQDDVRLICSKLPGAREGEERFGFSVETKGKAKGFLWSWAEKVHPKKARIVNDEVIAIVVPNLTAKELILEPRPRWSVEDPHYNGYPAVLVLLSEIDLAELEDLVVEGWRSKASAAAVKQFDEVEGSP
jgi:hypothetical protein